MGDPLEHQIAGLERLWEHESVNDQRWLNTLYSAPWVERNILRDIDPDAPL